MPIERTHWEIIILALPYSKLFLKVGKGIKLMGSVEFLIIFAVATLHLAVVSWSERLDLFAADAELCQCFLKKGKRFLLAVAQLVCEFKAVVRLHAFNGIGKFLYHMFEKLRRRIGALLLKCL